MATHKKSQPTKTGEGHGKRLSEEKKAAIPLLYARLGSKSAVARELDCAVRTVCYHLEQLPDEQWERIQSEQVKELARRSVEMLFRVMELTEPKLEEGSIRDLIGAYKQLREGATAFGAIEPRAQTDGTDLDRFLAEAKQRDMERAIQEAVRTGDLEPLRHLVEKPQEREKVPAS